MSHRLIGMPATTWSRKGTRFVVQLGSCVNWSQPR